MLSVKQRRRTRNQHVLHNCRLCRVDVVLHKLFRTFKIHCSFSTGFAGGRQEATVAIDPCWLPAFQTSCKSRTRKFSTRNHAIAVLGTWRTVSLGSPSEKYRPEKYPGSFFLQRIFLSRFLLGAKKTGQTSDKLHKLFISFYGSMRSMRWDSMRSMRGGFSLIMKDFCLSLSPVVHPCHQAGCDGAFYVPSRRGGLFSYGSQGPLQKGLCTFSEGGPRFRKINPPRIERIERIAHPQEAVHSCTASLLTVTVTVTVYLLLAPGVLFKKFAQVLLRQGMD
jgi:hypothetical protein